MFRSVAAVTLLAILAPAGVRAESVNHSKFPPSLGGIFIMMERPNIDDNLRRNGWNVTTCHSIKGATGRDRKAEVCRASSTSERRRENERLIIEYADSPVLKQTPVTYVALYHPIEKGMTFGYGRKETSKFANWVGKNFGAPDKVKKDKLVWLPADGDASQWKMTMTPRMSGKSNAVLIETVSPDFENFVNSVIKTGYERGFRQIDISDQDDLSVGRRVDPGKSGSGN